MISKAVDRVSVGDKVCVIGTGVMGLLAMKNLREQGLHVTALERNEYIGGNWHVTKDPRQVSALPGTKANVSKHAVSPVMEVRSSCPRSLLTSALKLSFSDYPMPDEYPVFPTAQQIGDYLESYAKNFDLLQYIEFSTGVSSVKRDEASNSWFVNTKDAKTGQEVQRQFDRIVIATGSLNVMNVPKVEGIETFAGDAIHSREFKDPTKYAGKNVLVVGLGSTGADTLVFLKNAGAKNVYLSQRHRASVIPRWIKGRPHDHHITRRADYLTRLMAEKSPYMINYVSGRAVEVIDKIFYPSLKSHPIFAGRLDGVLHHTPFVNDDFSRLVENGEVQALPGIARVSGPRSVVFKNGTEVGDLDAIIFCSGYYYDSSLIEGDGHPADPAFASDGFERFRNSRFHNPGNHYQRLYHGFLSEKYPDSLAVLGQLGTPRAIFFFYDLVTMALGGTLQRGPMPYLGLRIDVSATYAFLNRAAGTGIIEKVEGWGFEAWQFWWSNRKLHGLIMDGVNCSAVYRLLDTGRGRKPWKGAVEAIEKANEESDKMALTATSRKK
ncbi:Monooxygenase aurF [Cladobotryum mycophilum]|uniref:Monooxygenase aurF n=1 Tax=Cladobotryum mycophilum TaxID=491253 RepID=A0ABR0T4J4_9HYPO